MSPLRWLLGITLLVGATTGCASAEVTYTPRPGFPPSVGAPRDYREVELLDRVPPVWDYEVAGDFQELERDSVGGGRAGHLLLMRWLASQRGCDGVVVGGNATSFDGRYRYVWRRRRLSDGSPAGRWVPVFEPSGIGAECLVRDERDGATARADRPAEPPGDVPLFR